LQTLPGRQAKDNAPSCSAAKRARLRIAAAREESSCQSSGAPGDSNGDLRLSRATRRYRPNVPILPVAIKIEQLRFEGGTWTGTPFTAATRRMGQLATDSNPDAPFHTNMSGCGRSAFQPSYKVFRNYFSLSWRANATGFVLCSICTSSWWYVLAMDKVKYLQLVDCNGL
jgi:hypothetical protein